MTSTKRSLHFSRTAAGRRAGSTPAIFSASTSATTTPDCTALTTEALATQTRGASRGMPGPFLVVAELVLEGRVMNPDQKSRIGSFHGVLDAREARAGEGIPLFPGEPLA